MMLGAVLVNGFGDEATNRGMHPVAGIGENPSLGKGCLAIPAKTIAHENDV
jgi:hypothetical protein